MRVHVVDHPLVAHKLTILRDKNTPSMIFRQLTEELVMLLGYEATRGVAVEPREIETPVSRMTGTQLKRPRPLIVPILRAGLGMLEGMVKMAPSAEVGFLGMARNEQTLDIVTYAERLPDGRLLRLRPAHDRRGRARPAQRPGLCRTRPADPYLRQRAAGRCATRSLGQRRCDLTVN